MIEVSHVSRLFGEFRAVDDISFSIQTGEIVGLLGPNGAGKTTTMRMITGFLDSTSGSIKIDGIDVRENPVATKGKIGYMPESAPMYSDMIVADYLEYVAQIEGQLYSAFRPDMISMDQSLLKLYRDKRITRETALHYATNPEFLEKKLI